MYIRKILSYGNSWSTLNEKFPLKLNEIISSLKDITIDTIDKAELPSRYQNSTFKNNQSVRLEFFWTNMIEQKGWIASEEYVLSESTRKFNMKLLGHISNKVSIKFMRHREIINRWMYTISPMAYKNSIISLPIAVCLLRNSSEQFLNNKHSMMGSDFEYIKEELSALAPLSNTTPFLIIGVSLNDGEIEVEELESETELGNQSATINRSIEFPAEYHQAGLGILNYFGTIIREKYPDKHAKVKIEQDGLTVRMIIETEDGNQEIIEKALKEYELVLRGEKPIEELVESQLQVINLKSELRIAEVRLENARDLIEHKNQEIKTLTTLFGHSLTNKINPVIDVKVSPTIQITNKQLSITSINSNFSDINGELDELITMASSSPEVEMKLIDLNQSLDNISQDIDPEKIKNSSALKKLKLFIEESQNVGDNVNKFITTAMDGIDKIMYLGEKYNAIAEWCGAPQIPKVFVKKS